MTNDNPVGAAAVYLRGAPVTLETAARVEATDLLVLLRSRSEGLSAEEASAVLRLVGPNRPPPHAERSLISKLAAPLTHFFARCSG